MTATPIRYHADDTADGLFRAVVEHPFDLRPRLVLADRLDEIGEGERAEFIRLQIEVAAAQETGRLMAGSPEMERARVLRLRLYSDQTAPAGVMYCDRQCAHAVTPDDVIHVLNNGDVEEVRCSLGWWLGGECENCEGSRCTGDYAGCDCCAACHGTGTTPGHGADVVARHPVTAVRVVGREPHQRPNGSWLWFGAAVPHPPAELPRELFRYPRLLDVFPTRDLALAALSRALVDLARERAGLPAIHWEGQSS